MDLLILLVRSYCIGVKRFSEVPWALRSTLDMVLVINQQADPPAICGMYQSNSILQQNHFSPPV